MENYIVKAAKEGILFLYDLAYENNYKIKNYIVDKENKQVTIKYMDDREVTKSLDNVDIETLHLQQIEEFKESKQKILKRAKYQFVFTSGACAFYTLAAALLYAYDYYFEGSVYTVGSVTFFTFAHKNYKLRKHMNLVEWICDNEEKVNEVLKQQPEYKINNEGINLNNISNISDKDLKKIKKKVLSKNNRG